MKDTEDIVETLAAASRALDERDTLQRSLAASQARVKELEDALRPFVTWTRHIHPIVSDSVKLKFPMSGSTVGDLRRAAELLTGKP